MSTKQKLAHRLINYYKLEKFHTIWIFVFTVILNFKYSLLNTLLLDYGMALIIFILAQGTYFWKIKLDSLTSEPMVSEGTKRLFLKFKYLNISIIAIYPLVLLLLQYANLLIRQENKTWAFFAYVFGVAEYINYYHLQLMYDNKNDVAYLLRRKRLKIAHLKKMIS